ncbi:MAG: HAMP domain-containing sensor histidine kinase, partial [Planctomycetota bacterium]|nr:HAMP domain-containing sensor histidine kinase [Planctomycetota bacterium]
VAWGALATEHRLAARPHPDDPGGALYPLGLGWAVEMVRATADALGENAGSVQPQAIRDVLLRAEEVRGLNAQAGRLPSSALAAYLRDLDLQSRRLLDHAPETVRDALLWELAIFRRTQEALLSPDTGEIVRAQVFAARDVAQQHKSRPIAVVPQAAGLFGVYSMSRTQALVVGLDAAGVQRLVDGQLGSVRSQLEELGMTAWSFPATVDPLGPEGLEPAASVDLIGPVHLPTRLAIFQTSQPSGAEDGASTILFWAVILLAGAGLSVGGYVLIRLLTREIRLAQLKADFVSNLSHELKTPITSMLIFSEMLEDGQLPDPEQHAEAVAVIGQEARRLRRIVTRMIDVARGEARTSPYQLKPGDLNRPVLEAATRFRRIVTEPGLDLGIELHPGRLPVQMDLQALDDVVTNLLSNAWKYKREDHARIVVRTLHRGRTAEIVVQDDGVGIPRSERRKVFEMFYRSDQYLTQPVAGTGLGLALVRSVVTAHRGRVRADGAPGGVGTVFTVSLPTDRNAAAALARAPASDAADADSHGKVLPS